MQGWRTGMEDAHLVSLDLALAGPEGGSGDGAAAAVSRAHLLAVFDGHGGGEVARLAAEVVEARIKGDARISAGGDNERREALENAFLAVDETLRTDDGAARLAKIAHEIAEEEGGSGRRGAAAGGGGVGGGGGALNLSEMMREAMLKHGITGDEDDDEDDYSDEDESGASKSGSGSGEEKAKKKKRGKGGKVTDALSAIEVMKALGVGGLMNVSEEYESDDDEEDADFEAGSDSDGDGEGDDAEIKEASKKEEEPGAGAVVAKRGRKKAQPVRKASGEGDEVQIKGQGAKVDSKNGASGGGSDGDEDKDEDEDEDEDEDSGSGAGAGLAAGGIDLAALLAGGAGGGGGGGGNDDDDDDEGEFVEEEPGSEVGATAVAALLVGDTIYCANAGDSRCILSRDGSAVALSHDHSPEVETEIDRIVAAGGTIVDGRVNGNLNLTRAVGDLQFKQDKDLAPSEQIISAHPDVMTIRVHPSDEFLVLCCDGITNVMHNQEIVDFVRERIGKGVELSKIAEEAFDFCVSDDLEGDCNGTDNMTMVIYEFAKVSGKKGKRAAEPGTPNEGRAMRPRKI